MASPIRVGTCSWADKSLVEHWYPRDVKTAEARLRYYAEHFTTVEVDSTYYRLPEPEHGRTLGRAYAGRVRLPREGVRGDDAPPRQGSSSFRPTSGTRFRLDERGRVDRPPKEFRAEVFGGFSPALEPLRAAGKLGGILLQFPSYIV